MAKFSKRAQKFKKRSVKKTSKKITSYGLSRGGIRM